MTSVKNMTYGELSDEMIFIIGSSFEDLTVAQKRRVRKLSRAIDRLYAAQKRAERAKYQRLFAKLNHGTATYSDIVDLNAVQRWTINQCDKYTRG